MLSRSWLALAVLGSSALTIGCSGTDAKVPDGDATRTLGSTRVLGASGTYGDQRWLGLRYAQAPVGERRFRAPVKHVEKAAELSALASGSACPQLGHSLGVADAPEGELVGDEDCLFLDVYAPRMTADEANAARLPVMVWIHGGGNVVGHAAGYNGGRLAQQERVIAIAINYRLGPIGFFSHPALREGSSPADGSGNYGLLDIIAALEWVRDHVASFGGDPGNVTIFGESAGARDVLALLTAPSARGLFHRAIAQSGMVRKQERAHAEKPASEGGHLNSSSEVLARLLVAKGKASDEAAARSALAAMGTKEIAGFVRAVTPGELVGAYRREQDESLISVPNLIADGAVLPDAHPLELLGRAETRADVPIVLGTTRDENKTFLFGQERHVRRVTPLYMRLRDAPRYNALAAAMSLSWRVGGADAPARALTESGAQVYVYRFDWDEQPTILGADLSEMIGAGHGIDIPFVFGHFDLGRRANVMFTDDNAAGREELAQAMMRYWAELARTGRPGRGGTSSDRALPEWPPFGSSRAFMVLDTSAGGGVRLSAGEVAMPDVIASVASDARLRDARERCAVLREVIRWSALLPADAYPALQEGACKDYPFEVDPFR